MDPKHFVCRDVLEKLKTLQMIEDDELKVAITYLTETCEFLKLLGEPFLFARKDLQQKLDQLETMKELRNRK